MIRLQNLLASPHPPVKWLFCGDSITQGALHTFGYRDYTELFSERMRFEIGRSSDVVINTAISGHTTRQLLGGFDWRIAQFKPDAVFLMVGMNDACPEASKHVPLPAFGENMRQLIEQIQALGAIPVLQTACAILEEGSGGRFEALPAYMEALRQIAAECQVPLIDHQAHWQRFGDRLPYVLSDAIHPNEMGHRVMAHTLFEHLNIFDPRACTCRLFTP